MNPNLKKKFFGGGGGGGGVRGGEGARVSECFSQRTQKLKKIFLFVGRGGRGWRGMGRGVGGKGKWMDRRSGPNQFAPSTAAKFGA